MKNISQIAYFYEYNNLLLAANVTAKSSLPVQYN